jgi:ribonuclease Z
LLVQGLWLGGREEPLPIHGPQEALDVALKMLEIFSLAEQEGMFAIEWHPIPLREGRRVLDLGGVQITSTPVSHRNTPTVAVRLENAPTGQAIVYSSDTEPCPTLIRLAAGADLLLHEATGEYSGHSSPVQAAEVARQAGVAKLVLIHYPVHGVDLEAWRLGAAEFPGPVALAQDGDVYPF